MAKKEYLIIVTPAVDRELTEDHLGILNMDGWELISVLGSGAENKYYLSRDCCNKNKYDKKFWRKIFIEYVKGPLPINEVFELLENLTETTSSNEEE